MQLILHYLKRYKKLFVLNIISVFGFALVELGIPTIVSEMIDNGIMNQDKQYLIRMGIVIAVISLIGVSGTILLGYCCAKISTSVTRDIREDVFQKVQTFSHNEMNQFGIASLITRTNNDAFQIMTFLNVILRTALFDTDHDHCQLHSDDPFLFESLFDHCIHRPCNHPGRCDRRKNIRTAQ